MFVVCVFFSTFRPSTRIDIVYHYAGTWKYVPGLDYVGDRVCHIQDYDVVDLYLRNIITKYYNLGYLNVDSVSTLQPDKSMSEGLFLINDDAGVRKLLQLIDSYVGLIELFACHEVNIPVYAQNILSVYLLRQRLMMVLLMRL